MAVIAYVLIQTEVGRAARVADDVAKLGGVQSAKSVTGPYDVIVRAEAESSTSWAGWSSAGSSWSRASQEP